MTLRVLIVGGYGIFGGRIVELLKDEPGQEQFCRKNGKIFREGGQVVHVNTFLKEDQ